MNKENKVKKDILLITDRTSNQRANYLQTLNNIKAFFSREYPTITGWKHTWGMFDHKIHLKSYKNFLYNNLLADADEVDNTNTSNTWEQLKEEEKLKIQAEVNRGCKELLDHLVECNRQDSRIDLRLIFLDTYGMEFFVKYLLDNGFEPFDRDNETIQKETLTHFFNFNYYSLHGKLLILKKDNLIIKLGRTLPLVLFALDGNTQPLAEALTFVITDIKHLIEDDRPQIIEKPKNEDNSWNWTSYYIDTIEKFDDFYNKLINSNIVCIDTETSNLNKINNKILTFHFSLTGEEAYNIPYLHRETPFCSDELEYIKQKLKQYFENGHSEYLIFHNAKFDLSVIRGTLGVRGFSHKIYDTMFGCYAIDENRKFIRSTFPRISYGLGHLAEEYGCLAYLEGELGKHDRANMEEHSLASIMQYASKDVVVPYKVHKFQLEEAELLGYKDFKVFVLNVLGEIGKTFCNIEFQGLLMDINYTTCLLQPNGVLMNIRDNLLKQFRESKNCIKTNALLHVNNEIRDNLNELAKLLKKALRTKGIKEKLSAEQVKTTEKLVKYIEDLLKPNSTLTQDFTLYRNIGTCFWNAEYNLKDKINQTLHYFIDLNKPSLES